MKLTVVSNERGCPLCKAAKTALDRESIAYTNYDTFSEEGALLMATNGVRTIPAFFDGETFLGDYQWFLKTGYSQLRNQ